MRLKANEVGLLKGVSSRVSQGPRPRVAQSSVPIIEAMTAGSLYLPVGVMRDGQRTRGGARDAEPKRSQPPRYQAPRRGADASAQQHSARGASKDGLDGFPQAAQGHVRAAARSSLYEAYTTAAARHRKGKRCLSRKSRCLLPLGASPSTGNPGILAYEAMAVGRLGKVPSQVSAGKKKEAEAVAVVTAEAIFQCFLPSPPASAAAALRLLP